MGAHTNTTKQQVADLLQFGPAAYYPLLLSVYLASYVKPAHLLRLLPHFYRSERTAYRHLAHLRVAGLLKLVNETPRPGEPYVYHTTGLARAFLRSRQNVLPIINSRGETVQESQIKHALGISDLQADVMYWLHHHPDLELGLMERRYFHHTNYMTHAIENGKPFRLEPDLGLLVYLSQNGVKHPFKYFVELDRGNQDMRTIRDKVSQYQAWYEFEGRQKLRQMFSQGGLARPKATYRLVFVTRDRRGHDMRRLARILLSIRRVTPRPKVMLTTFDLLHQHRRSLNPAVWYLVDDVSLPEDATVNQTEAYFRDMPPRSLLPIPSSAVIM